MNIILLIIIIVMVVITISFDLSILCISSVALDTIGDAEDGKS